MCFGWVARFKVWETGVMVGVGVGVGVGVRRCINNKMISLVGVC